MSATEPNEKPMYQIRNEARKRLGIEKWREQRKKFFEWRSMGRNHEWRYRAHPAESTVPEGLYVGFEAIEDAECD